jgi:hypothetical protein
MQQIFSRFHKKMPEGHPEVMVRLAAMRAVVELLLQPGPAIRACGKAGVLSTD